MARLKLTIEELLARFDGAASVEGAGAAIGTNDREAGVYARVLEYGSIAGQPPWPGPGARTALAVAPESGVQVVVSAQAPQGYIRMRVPHFVALLRAHLPGPIDWLDGSAIEEQVREAVRAAAADALEALRSGAPADSGRLRESLAMAAD
jgi:hypothetical protein